MLSIIWMPPAQASTVWVEFRTRQAFFVDYPSNVTYMTSFGEYAVDKLTGAIQYTWRNGTILSPATKFIVQYLQAQDSWEDFSFAQPVFMEVKDHYLQWRQTVFNGSGSLGYVVTDALFSESEPPKLSIVWDKPEVAGLTFRILFKVTIPQAWEYFINGEDFINIPKGSALSLMRQEMRVVESPEKSVLKLLVDWSDYGQTEVLLKGSTVTVVFPENVREVDPTILGETTSMYATTYSYQRKKFYAQGRYWEFYSNGTHAVWVTSTDGESWTAETVIRASDAGYKFDIDFDGTNIHYSYAPQSSGGALTYRMGTPQSDGSITWATTEQTAYATPAGNKTYRPFVTVDSSGYPWIGYQLYNSSNFPYVIKSSWNNGSWSTQSGFPYTLNNVYSVSWFVSVVPLTSNRTYTFYVRQSQTNPVKGRLWNGTDWSSEEDITSRMYYYPPYSAVGVNDDVHLVFLNRTTYEIVYMKRTYGSGWGSEETLASASSTSYPVLTKDGSKLFVFWANSDVVYYRGFVSGSWQSTVTWMTSSGFREDTIISPYEKRSSKLGLSWTAGSSSPYSVMFEHFVYSVTVNPFIIYNVNNDFGVHGASWDDGSLELTFRSMGDITVDTSTYGLPYLVYDGESFLSWSSSGSNISFTASGSSIKLSWMYPTETETRATGGKEPSNVTDVADIFKPVVSPLAQLGLYGLVAGMVLITVAGIASASSKKKVVRKPSGKSARVRIKASGKGTTKKIKVKGAKNYGGNKPKGVGRKKQKWD